MPRHTNIGIQVYLTTEEHEILVELVKAHGLSKAEIFRQALLLIEQTGKDDPLFWTMARRNRTR